MSTLDTSLSIGLAATGVVTAVAGSGIAYYDHKSSKTCSDERKETYKKRSHICKLTGIGTLILGSSFGLAKIIMWAYNRKK